jgi:hypothetical protein
MNIENVHMDVVDDDIHDAVDLNMNEIKDEINVKKLIKE